MVVRQTGQTDGNGSLPLNFLLPSPYFGAVNSHCLKTIVFGYLLSNKDSGRWQALIGPLFFRGRPAHVTEGVMTVWVDTIEGPTRRALPETREKFLEGRELDFDTASAVPGEVDRIWILASRLGSNE